MADGWLWGIQPRLLLPTVPVSVSVSRLVWLLLLASLLPSAWPASPLPRALVKVGSAPGARQGRGDEMVA